MHHERPLHLEIPLLHFDALSTYLEVGVALRPWVGTLRADPLGCEGDPALADTFDAHDVAVALCPTIGVTSPMSSEFGRSLSRALSVLGCEAVRRRRGRWYRRLTPCPDVARMALDPKRQFTFASLQERDAWDRAQVLEVAARWAHRREALVENTDQRLCSVVRSRLAISALVDAGELVRGRVERRHVLVPRK